MESHFEVRTDQPVGDLPRSSDVVLLRKTAATPPPFQGLWRRLTTWNALEYKGPTVSPRFDDLHDLIELGLGIHRRLNELQRKEQAPEMDYPEVSFWYLVNHIGRRFLAEAPTYLPGIQQETEGIWRASLFGHPVFLVSVQELRVERDSMALHVLAGVPDQEKGIIVEALKAEPGLIASYAEWLFAREPAIWKEISLMAARQQQQAPVDYNLMAENLKSIGGLNPFLEALGTEGLWAALSPRQREEMCRLVQKEKSAENDRRE